MEIFVESFPFVFGVLLGLTAYRMGGIKRHKGLWAAVCVVLGALATLSTGEYRESLLYFVFDMGLVAMVSVGTAALLELRRRTVN
jgi:hypothetical protein